MRYSQNSRHCSDATMKVINDRLDEVDKELKKIQKKSNKRCCTLCIDHPYVALNRSRDNCWTPGDMKEHAEIADHAMNRAVRLFQLC